MRVRIISTDSLLRGILNDPINRAFVFNLCVCVQCMKFKQLLSIFSVAFNLQCQISNNRFFFYTKHRQRETSNTNDIILSAKPHIIYNKYSHHHGATRTSIHAYNRTKHTINQCTTTNTTSFNPNSQYYPIRSSHHCLPAPITLTRLAHDICHVQSIQSNQYKSNQSDPINTIQSQPSIHQARPMANHTNQRTAILHSHPTHTYS